VDLGIRGTLAFLLALALVLALGWPTIALLRGRGLGGSVREDTPESHQSKKGTPSMGGVLLVPAAAVAIVATSRLDAAALGTAGFMLAFAALGAVDDLLKATQPSRRGLMARHKFLAQVGLAFGVVAFAVLALGNPGRVGALPGHGALELGALAVVLWMLYVLWLSNAVNITDGLDGLASGLTITVAAALLIGGILAGKTAGVTCSAALLGACLGFLRFNRRPAHVIMGDTGALGIGGGLAALAVFTSDEWVLVAAGLPFTIELLSVVVQVTYFQATKRLCHLQEGRRIFRKSPLHHHFEEGGAGEREVVLGFWLTGTLCSVLTIAVLVWERGPLC